MPIIICENLAKEYRLGQFASLRETLFNQFRRLAQRSVAQREHFKALDDISFSVEPGEVLGIIGHNGAGKSTLLKLLAGITTPTVGRLSVSGRIAPLIEVGAGFVPNLTGRENVYLNGSILGLSRKEIDRKFDEIVDFAEMAEFIDTPVKRYSSGMQVKLAFSVATGIEAEILIVDEVLAVGDLAFQRKCFDRMEGLIKRQGRTVLIVSHNIRQISRMCSRVVLLDHGRITSDGPPTKVCNLFYEQSNARILNNVAASSASALVNTSGEITLRSIDILDQSRTPSDKIRAKTSMTVHFRLIVNNRVDDPEFIVGIHTTDFVYLVAASTRPLKHGLNLSLDEHEVECTFPSIPLAPGVYCIWIGVVDKFRRTVYAAENLKPFTVEADEEHISLPARRVFDIPNNWKIDGAHWTAETTS